MTIARRVTFVFLVSLFWSGQLAAQTGTISGRVTDAATTAPVAGVSLLIDGTQRGTTAAADGSFTILGVPVGTYRLTARLIGYAPVTQDVTVTGQTVTVDFALARQALVMDEVVVTGYGSQRRAEITGSVATINADDANKGVVTNANEMIQGRIAGVQVVQNGGEPGAGIQIRVRGGTSISASNQPLYVIDGVVVQNLPTEATALGIGSGDPYDEAAAALPRSPLNLINPADIESITVLKDAAAAAIYGTRGANGVVLIETKQGQREQLTFEYDGYVSVATPARKLGLLNGDEYRAYVQEQVTAGSLPASRLDQLGSANTDWEDELTRSAVVQNHNLSFSGGSAATQYRASLSYMNQEGVTIGNGLERFTGRLNGTHYAWDDRLQLRLNLTASTINNDYIPFENRGGFEGGVFQNMVQYNPTQPVMVTDPTTGEQRFNEVGPGTQSVRNPVALTQQIADEASTTRVLGNVRAQWDIVPNLLSTQFILGADQSKSTRREYYPAANPVGAQWNGLASQKSREVTTTSLQWLGTLYKNFGGQHNFELIGGYEFNETTQDDFRAEARDFLTDAFSFDNLAAGGQLVAPASRKEVSRLIGFFGRLTYGLKDRYFLTGVLRRDGSTKFGADHKWAVFPAISGSWRLSEESFLRGGLFSELRLRAGYGLQGNEAVAPYASLLILAPSDGDSYPFGDTKTVGVAPVRAANPDLKWEQTSQFNVGLDFGLLNNRISGTFEYFVKNTDDLLLEVPVPQPAVQDVRFENIGKVSNRGFEALLDGLLITTRTTTLTAGLTFAAGKNEVQDLGGREFITSGGVSGQGQSGQTSQRILPGYALGTFYGPEFVGINAAGEQEFNAYDASGNLTGVTTSPGANDFLPIGDANPNFILGIRSGFTWKGLDASFIGRWEQGKDVFNNTALVHGAKSNVLQDKNFLKSALDDDDAITQPAIFSSRWIETGSFFRLQNIVVGYTFDLPGWLSGGGNTARIYVASDNLLLITNYSGFDPEAVTRAGLESRSIDYLSYPRGRSFTTGIRLTF